MELIAKNVQQHIKEDSKVLFVVTASETSQCKEMLAAIEDRIGAKENLIIDTNSSIEKGTQQDSYFDVILSGYEKTLDHNSEVLKQYYRLLKPGGVVLLHETDQESQNAVKSAAACESRLKLNGFTVTATSAEVTHPTDIVAQKPNYEKSTVQLKLAFNGDKPATEKFKWKIDDDDDMDLIDESSLIDPKESSQSQKFVPVCAPTTDKKRKACKNCTCGLADQEEEEKKSNEKEAPKSSCGSCYLGDAFRCSSCPYLGMPAFKPGEKVTIPSLD